MRFERYAYDPGDGVRAALLLFAAGRCFQRTGHVDASNDASLLAERLVARLQSDYAAAHVALEHALGQQNWAEALLQSRRLLAFAEHTSPDPYTHWLRGVASRVATYADTKR